MNELSRSISRHDAQKLALVRAPDLPSQPVRGPVRPVLLAAGIAAGLFAAWLIRRPKRNLGLVGFAAAGAAAAIAVSFLIGDRYTSSAVVRLTPPQASAEPLTAHLRQLLEQIVPPESRRAVEVRTVGPDAFMVAFTDADPHKAQESVRRLLTQLVERNVSEQQDRPTFEVLDPATLPGRPVYPNRLVIGAFGLPVGLLAGVLVLRRRTVQTP